MLSALKEKLWAYIVQNNPELMLSLQGTLSVTTYLETKVKAVLPLAERLIKEGRPQHVIQELCLNEMTADLRPSKFNYLKTVLEEEFPDDFERMVEAGILTYELVNLIAVCKEHFETFEFSEGNEDNRFLRYAIIAEVQQYLV